MSNAKQFSAGRNDLAIDECMALARKVFKSRGDRTEAHLNRAELAALLTLAFERGARMAADAALPYLSELEAGWGYRARVRLQEIAPVPSAGEIKK